MHTKLCSKFARSNAETAFGIVVLAYGVIGNTTGFGPVILGSSPSRPTEIFQESRFHLISGFFIWYPVQDDGGLYMVMGIIRK